MGLRFDVCLPSAFLSGKTTINVIVILIGMLYLDYGYNEHRGIFTSKWLDE